MIDTNVHLFQWPFRRLAADDPAELAKRLQERGVTEAWAGSFEALLCRDVSGVNARLADGCRRYGENFLVPFGCVNPNMPDWEEDLRRCHEEYGMPGIRVYPNYHGYSVGSAGFAQLLSLAERTGMAVQIALSMEDIRTQFPLMVVPPTDPAPLAESIAKYPRLKLMMLNAGYWTDERRTEIDPLRKARNVYFDIAMNEGIGGLVRLRKATAPERVVFGSHHPFFYFESALLKVRSAGLPHDEEAALLEENARAFLGRG